MTKVIKVAFPKGCYGTKVGKMATTKKTKCYMLMKRMLELARRLNAYIECLRCNHIREFSPSFEGQKEHCQLPSYQHKEHKMEKDQLALPHRV